MHFIIIIFLFPRAHKYDISKNKTVILLLLIVQVPEL